MACWVWLSSEVICAALIWVRCGWVQLWLPIHMPACCWARTSDWFCCAFCPMLKKVARTPLAVRVLISVLVVPGLGPSS